MKHVILSKAPSLYASLEIPLHHLCNMIFCTGFTIAEVVDDLVFSLGMRQ